MAGARAITSHHSQLRDMQGVGRLITLRPSSRTCPFVRTLFVIGRRLVCLLARFHNWPATVLSNRNDPRKASRAKART